MVQVSCYEPNPCDQRWKHNVSKHCSDHSSDHDRSLTYCSLQHLAKSETALRNAIGPHWQEFKLVFKRTSFSFSAHWNWSTCFQSILTWGRYRSRWGAWSSTLWSSSLSTAWCFSPSLAVRKISFHRLPNPTKTSTFSFFPLHLQTLHSRQLSSFAKAISVIPFVSTEWS